MEKEKFPVWNFFIRRFFRIAPMYYIGICYYLFQNGFGPRFYLGDATHISVLNILSNITFLHGFNPYYINSIVPGGWSIAVEMTFYAVLPLLFSKIKNINQAFNLFVISIALRFVVCYIPSLLPLIASKDLWSEFLFFYFPSQLPIFCIGIIMYFIISEKNNLATISKKSVLVFSILFLASLATDNAFILTSHILFGIGFLIFSVAISQYKPIVIVNPIINYIGKISFSMYLVHFAVIYWLKKYNLFVFTNNGILDFIIGYAIVVLITAGISILLYKAIEVPFQNIGKRLINRMEK